MLSILVTPLFPSHFISSFHKTQWGLKKKTIENEVSLAPGMLQGQAGFSAHLPVTSQ
jgi:hypothetical protein